MRRGRRRLPAQMALLTSLGAAGCGEPRDVTTGFDRGDITIVDTVPRREAIGVAPSSSIDVCFSAQLYPTAFNGFEVLLTSGGSAFDTEVEISLFQYRTQGSRDELATSRWCEGSVLMVRPKNSLTPGATYRLRIVAGMYGWDDEFLESGPEGWGVESDGRRSYSLPFTVAADGPADSPPPTPATITLSDLFEGKNVFDPSTSYCSCHRESGSLPRQLLNLSTPNSAYADLVQDTTPQTTSFPMVSPGAPAASYLIQKLTDAGNGQTLHGVLGERMPAEGDLPVAAASSLSMWIATGASLE